MRANSNNNIIKAVLCFLIIIIIAIVGIFVIKTTLSGNDKKDGKETQNSQAEVQKQESSDTTVSAPEGESTAPSEPTTQTQPTTPTEPTTQGETSTQTQTQPQTQTQTQTQTQVQTQTQTQTQPQTQAQPQTQTTPSTAENWQQTLGSTEVAVPANAPKSYKDFSLTKDMTAEQAYSYIDSFLNSKYSILLNKQNKVASSYAPSDLITPSGCSYPMERVAGQALVQLMSAAKQNGIYDLVMYSGYRTVASQKNKFVTRTQKYLNQGYSQADAEAKAGEYIAPPGASEHHTGLAADVCSSTIVNKYGYLDDSFDTTASYQWMKANCAEYGFIIRYTKGDEAITGYSYEPWHLRYLGKDHAKACTDLGFTYEEYHAMLIQLRNSAK